jgi:hypothetical protein
MSSYPTLVYQKLTTYTSDSDKEQPNVTNTKFHDPKLSSPTQPIQKFLILHQT